MFNSYNQNPYFNPYFNTQPQQVPPMPMKYNTGLQGKSIDNLEVVKAMDIPLDGSISYFPLVDGTAIVTKQLQQDGTSKITVFKPIESDELNVQPKYATLEDIDNKLNNMKFITPEDLNNKINEIKLPDVKGLQEDIRNLKKQIRILLDKED